MDTVINGTQLVAYTGGNAATNAYTGCMAPVNAGRADDDAKVTQASTVVGTPALTQTAFTPNVSKNGTPDFSRTGMLLVTNSTNTEQLIRYTRLGVDSFEGCTAVPPGAVSALTGAAVTQAMLWATIDRLLNSIALP